FGKGAVLLNLQQLVAAFLAAALGVCLLGLLLGRLARFRRYVFGFVRFLRTGLRVLTFPRQLCVHLPLSLVLILLLLAQLYIAARAVGVVLSASQLLWLGPLVLLAMSAPSFFAGWGIREG